MSATDDQSLQHQLDELVNAPAPERARFLSKLGWERRSVPTGSLEPFFKDPDPIVRIAAAQARWLGAGNVEELDRLVGIIAEALASPEEDVRLAAGTALVNMEEPAVPSLIRWFESRGSHDTLGVRVIGEIGGSTAREFLRVAATAADTAVAAEAREALDALEEEERWEG